MGFHACIFNSQRICAQNLNSMGFCAYMFNSQRICARILCSDLLDYIWMKDPQGMLEDSLGLESVLVMILTYHEVLMVYGPLKKRVAYWDFLMVCCLLGNFLPLGNNYLPLSCDSLRIDIDSTLEGVLPNLLGKFLFASLEGADFVPWTQGGVRL